MKLITKAIEAKLAKSPLYSKDGQGDNAEVIVKFFDAMGRFTYFVTEAEKLDDGDYRFYGWCVSPLGSDCDEYGYMLFSQMKDGSRLLNRDLYFDAQSLASAKATG